MCVSLGPARFSNTLLYAGQVEVNGKLRNVLGYQNTVQNLQGDPPPTFGGPPLAGRPNPLRLGSGNAMILPFPAVPGTMTQGNVLDTSECPHILKDMAAANPFRSRGMSDALLNFSAKSVVIFEHDIYTVVLASDARLIHEVLDQVPEGKRPVLNAEVFEAYAKWYPGWTVALCCFNNEDEAEAAPLLWWYEPMDESMLFVPALDSHTGEVPFLDAAVVRDHTVALAVPGVEKSPAAGKVKYTDVIPDALRPYLPSHVAVAKSSEEYDPNGDFWFHVEGVRTRGQQLQSSMPPGAGPRPRIVRHNSLKDE